MKKLIILLSILFSSPAYCAVLILSGSQPASSYLVEEDFAGTTEPTGWTAIGTPDYTTEGQVIIDFNDWAITPVFAEQSTLYIAFKFNTGPMTGVGSSTIFRVYDTYDTALGYVLINVSDQFRVYMGTDNDTNQIALSVNTDYWVWITYTASSGANDGVMTLNVGSSGTYSASSEHAGLVAGTMTELPAYAELRQTGYDSNGDFIFYEIIISDSEIGDF